MKVKVEFFNMLRDKVGGLKFIEMEDVSTLRDVLHRLDEMFPDVRGEIWDGEHVRDDYIIMINGRNMLFLGKEDTVLKDGDEVSIFPPAAGG